MHTFQLPLSYTFTLVSLVLDVSRPSQQAQHLATQMQTHEGESWRHPWDADQEVGLGEGRRCIPEWIEQIETAHSFRLLASTGEFNGCASLVVTTLGSRGILTIHI